MSEQPRLVVPSPAAPDRLGVEPPPAAPSPAVRAAIERVIDQLNRLSEAEEPGTPGWAEQELTFGQLRLLFLLRSHGPLTISRVAEWLGVGLPAASGTLDRLERHGLVERRHRSDDRRIVECLLTEDGHRLVDEIVGTRSESFRRLLGVLSADELDVLEHLLEIVAERTNRTARSPSA